MKTKTILAIIPARGGSKRLPDKNIRPFAGTPLIAHTIKLARRCSAVDRIIVDTDSPKIATIARRYGAEVPFLRPAQLATDKALMVDAILHSLDRLAAQQRYRPDFVMLLQPNAPLTIADDLNRCVAVTKTAGVESVATVAATQPLLFTIKPNGTLEMANRVRLTSTNAQQLPGGYLFTGSVFLIKTSVLRRVRRFFTPATRPVEIPRWRAIDIDTAEDLALAELVYRNRTALNQRIKQLTSNRK